MRRRWQNSALGQSVGLLSIPERQKIFAVLLLQICMGFIDLLAVILIGVLSSLAVTGVASRNPGSRVGQVLEFLHINNESFQFQVGTLGISAALLMIARTLLSMYFSKKILRFLSIRAAVISKQLLAKMLNQSLLFIQGRTSQQTLYALTNGVSAITVGIIGTAINVAADVSLMLVMLIGLFVLDPLISMTMVVGFASIGFLLYQTMHKKAKKLGKDSSHFEIASSESIFEVINTYREAIVKDKRDYYVNKIGDYRFNLSSTQAELAFMPNISKYVIESVVVLGSLILCAIQFTIQDAMHAVATLAVFLTSATRIAPAALRVQQASIQLKSNSGSAGPTLNLIKELKQIDTQQFPRISQISQDIGFTPQVSLKEVSVTYPGAELPALQNVTLDVLPGEFIGVTGLSGSGKSTLVDALLGIIPVTSGEVRISGTAPGLAISIWPGKIGYVPQQVTIVPGTIMRNIALGEDENRYSKINAWNALESAQLSEFVKTLPDGIDTIIGEGGAGLSGGQRQRLGIARAMYSKPSLLILDEATSALDSQTEKMVSESIEKLQGDITIIVIAHRMSTILDADRIVFLEAGEVVGVDGFENLKKSSSLFQKLALENGL